MPRLNEDIFQEILAYDENDGICMMRDPADESANERVQEQKSCSLKSCMRPRLSRFAHDSL